MTCKQKRTWIYIGFLVLALALATSMIDDTSGARTLARGTLGFMVFMYIRVRIAEYFYAKDLGG